MPELVIGSRLLATDLGLLGLEGEVFAEVDFLDFLESPIFSIITTATFGTPEEPRFAGEPRGFAGDFFTFEAGTERLGLGETFCGKNTFF